MVALSFSVFYDLLVKDTNDVYVAKRQTIRRWNERRQEAMKRLGIQVFWKQRYKGQKLFDAILTGEIIRVRWVKNIYDGKEVCTLQRGYAPDGWLCFFEAELEDIALRDGFNSWNEMREWFVRKYGDALLKGDFAVIRFLKVAR